MNVSQIMTRNVFTAGPNDTLAKAAQIMWEKDVGCVPIVEEGRVIGMITDRDICMAAYMRGDSLQTLPISSAMSRQVHACSPKQSLADAEEVFRTRLIRRMPVLDANGALVGILSLNDLAREAIRQQGRRGRELGGDEVTATLAAVSQPRQPNDVARVS